MLATSSASAVLKDFPQFEAASFALIHASQVSGSRAEDKQPSACTEDAMIVFDASGSMSGNQTLGIPNSRARIDEARSALAQVLPNATKFRRVGLVTYGPGPYNQCNVKLNLKPTANATFPVMSAVNALVPAGKTPLTQGIEEAAEALDFRSKPGGYHRADRRGRDLRKVTLRPRQTAPCGGLQAHNPPHRVTRASLGRARAMSWT